MFTRRREQLLRSVAAGRAEAITPSDPDWQYCELLVDTVSADAQDNKTFDDGSTGNHSITANGDVTQGTFSPFSPNGFSMFFDGVDDYFTVADAAALRAGTGDFTVEAWITPYSKTGANFNWIFGKTTGTNGFAFGINTSNKWQYNDTGSAFITSTDTVDYGERVHFALCRASGTTRMFINGTQTGSSYADSKNWSSTVAVGVGRDAAGTFEEFSGVIHGLRFVVGTALYTTTFTPPTSELTAVTNTQLLVCQYNRHLDGSSADRAITVASTPKVIAGSPFPSTVPWSSTSHGGSGYFDGTGDYLRVAGSTDHDLGTGDFCIELWVYPLEALAAHIWVSSAISGTAVQLGYDTGNGPRYLFFYAGANRLTSSADVITPYMWNHVVVCRSGSDMSLYSNGIRRDTTTYSSGINLNPLDVGHWQYGGWDMKCFHGDVRIVKGDSVYDPTATTLTVPTAPLTAITNTVLLLNFTNAGIYDATGKHNIGLYGATETDTAVTKFAATSLKSPSGTTDYATVVGQSFPNIGAADFTFMTWVYFDSLGQQVVWDTRPISTVDASYVLLYMTTGNALTLNINGDRISTSALSAGTWYWVVVTRENRVNRMWLDGAYVGTYTDGSTFITPEDRPRIAGNGYATTSDHLKGHLESYQWYVGKALYTGTGSITVPTTVPAKRGA